MGGCGLRGQLKKRSCPRNPQPYDDYGHGPIASETKSKKGDGHPGAIIF
jgi:hypothetical protein